MPIRPPPSTNGSFVTQTIKLHARVRSKRINGPLPTAGLIDGTFRRRHGSPPPPPRYPYLRVTLSRRPRRAGGGETLVNHHSSSSPSYPPIDRRAITFRYPAPLEIRRRNTAWTHLLTYLPPPPPRSRCDSYSNRFHVRVRKWPVKNGDKTTAVVRSERVHYYNTTSTPYDECVCGSGTRFIVAAEPSPPPSVV